MRGIPFLQLTRIACLSCAEMNIIEYDTERAGTFEPLAEMPADKLVVLGVISSKLGQLESPEAMEAKVHSAAKIMGSAVGQSEEQALDRLAVSPQCGFAVSLAKFRQAPFRIVLPFLRETSC